MMVIASFGTLILVIMTGFAVGRYPLREFHG